MKNKLYITAISDTAKTVLDRQSHFNGMQYAKYQLISIDEDTNVAQAQLFVGDIITVLKNVLLQIGLNEITLGNFKLSLLHQNSKQTENDIVTVTGKQLTDAIGAEVHGDGLNALVRLADATHVAVAQVIGRRGKSDIDYGTMLVPAGANPGTTAQMVSWKSIKENIKAGKVNVHNISYDKEKDQLIRTNISNLDTIYLIVDAVKEKKPPKTKPVTDKKEAAQKNKLINNLMEAKSPLVYSLSTEYPLTSLQYILKTHTQGEPVDYMLNAEYTVEQLRALHRAYNKGIDVALIADPAISAKTMESVITKFDYGLWKAIDIENIHSKTLH